MSSLTGLSLASICMEAEVILHVPCRQAFRIDLYMCTLFTIWDQLFYCVLLNSLSRMLRSVTGGCVCLCVVGIAELLRVSDVAEVWLALLALVCCYWSNYDDGVLTCQANSLW